MNQSLVFTRDLFLLKPLRLQWMSLHIYHFKFNCQHNWGVGELHDLQFNYWGEEGGVLRDHTMSKKFI